MKIITGIKKPKAFRVVVYGTEGIGKTTLASKLPSPLFLDLENGTHGIDVACADIGIITFESVMGMLNELKSDKHGYKTLVIDSLDILEKIITQQICDESHKDSIEQVAAYGKGYVFVKDKFARILDKLSDLANTGMNIVCIGHSQLKVQTLPDEQGAFDRYELKLQKQIAPIVKEWCDTLLFVNYKTTIVSIQGEAKKKAQGGKRWVYTEHRPSWDAKHRASLPLPEDCAIEKATEELAKALGNTESQITVNPSVETVVESIDEEYDTAPNTVDNTPDYVKELLTLAKQYNITVQQLENYASAKLKERYGIENAGVNKYPKDFVAWLVRGMDKIATKIN